MNRDNIICTCNGVTIAQIEMAVFILEGQVEELECSD